MDILLAIVLVVSWWQVLCAASQYSKVEAGDRLSLTTRLWISFLRWIDCCPLCSTHFKQVRSTRLKQVRSTHFKQVCSTRLKQTRQFDPFDHSPPSLLYQSIGYASRHSVAPSATNAS